ncbi:hypothetical protein KXS07_08105 [Inquilinus limosus]|uniref:hypothetical protein n=1 Tax=Inquilinus limosus TaxID=171674 RepID=UPI003F15A4EC
MIFIHITEPDGRWLFIDRRYSHHRGVLPQEKMLEDGFHIFEAKNDAGEIAFRKTIQGQPTNPIVLEPVNPPEPIRR